MDAAAGLAKRAPSRLQQTGTEPLTVYGDGAIDLVHFVPGLPTALCERPWSAETTNYVLQNTRSQTDDHGVVGCAFASRFTPPAFAEGGDGYLHPTYDVKTTADIRVGTTTTAHSLVLTMAAENVVDARRFPLVRASVAPQPTVTRRLGVTSIAGDLTYSVLVDTNRPVQRVVGVSLGATCGSSARIDLDVSPESMQITLPSTSGRPSTLTMRYTGYLPGGTSETDASNMQCRIDGTGQFELASTGRVVTRALGQQIVTLPAQQAQQSAPVPQ